MKTYLIQTLLLTAGILLTGCSSSSEEPPVNPGSGNDIEEPDIPDTALRQIALSEQELVFDRNDRRELHFICTPATAEIGPDRFALVTDLNTSPDEIALTDITITDNTGTAVLVDRNASYAYARTLRLVYRDARGTVSSPEFTVKSEGYDDQIGQQLPAAEQSYTLTDTPQIVEVSSEGGLLHLAFDAPTDWTLFLSDGDEEINWAEPSIRSGSAGYQTIDLSLPANPTEDPRALRIDICAAGETTKTTIDDVTNQLRDIRVGFCTASVVQYSYYELFYRAVHVHLDEAGTLGACLREKFQETDEELASHIESLYVKGPLNESDFDYMRETLSNLRRIDLLNADVYTIPDRAFYRCQHLHYITLPLFLTRIGEQAFRDSGLKNANLTLPPYLSFIGKEAFCNTRISGTLYFSGLSTNTININGSAFANLPLLKEIIFGEGIRVINENPYSVVLSLYGTNLFRLSLPSTLEQMNCYLFNNARIAHIICRASYPPATAGTVSTDGVGLLIVPFGSYNAYANNDDWDYFAIQKKLFELPVFNLL